MGGTTSKPIYDPDDKELYSHYQFHSLYTISIFGHPIHAQQFAQMGSFQCTSSNIFGSVIMSPMFQPISKRVSNTELLDRFGLDDDNKDGYDSTIPSVRYGNSPREGKKGGRQYYAHHGCGSLFTKKNSSPELGLWDGSPYWNVNPGSNTIYAANKTPFRPIVCREIEIETSLYPGTCLNPDGTIAKTAPSTIPFLKITMPVPHHAETSKHAAVDTSNIILAPNMHGCPPNTIDALHKLANRFHPLCGFKPTHAPLPRFWDKSQPIQREMYENFKTIPPVFVNISPCYEYNFQPISQQAEYLSVGHIGTVLIIDPHSSHGRLTLDRFVRETTNLLQRGCIFNLAEVPIYVVWNSQKVDGPQSWRTFQTSAQIETTAGIRLDPRTLPNTPPTTTTTTTTTTPTNVKHVHTINGARREAGEKGFNKRQEENSIEAKNKTNINTRTEDEKDDMPGPEIKPLRTLRSTEVTLTESDIHLELEFTEAVVRQKLEHLGCKSITFIEAPFLTAANTSWESTSSTVILNDHEQSHVLLDRLNYHKIATLINQQVLHNIFLPRQRTPDRFPYPQFYHENCKDNFDAVPLQNVDTNYHTQFITQTNFAALQYPLIQWRIMLRDSKIKAGDKPLHHEDPGYISSYRLLRAIHMYYIIMRAAFEKGIHPLQLSSPTSPSTPSPLFYMFNEYTELFFGPESSSPDPVQPFLPHPIRYLKNPRPLTLCQNFPNLTLYCPVNYPQEYSPVYSRYGQNVQFAGESLDHGVVENEHTLPDKFHFESMILFSEHHILANHTDDPTFCSYIRQCSMIGSNIITERALEELKDGSYSPETDPNPIISILEYNRRTSPDLPRKHHYRQIHLCTDPVIKGHLGAYFATIPNGTALDPVTNPSPHLQHSKQVPPFIREIHPNSRPITYCQSSTTIVDRFQLFKTPVGVEITYTARPMNPLAYPNAEYDPTKRNFINYFGTPHPYNTPFCHMPLLHLTYVLPFLYTRFTSADQAPCIPEHIPPIPSLLGQSDHPIFDEIGSLFTHSEKSPTRASIRLLPPNHLTIPTELITKFNCPVTFVVCCVNTIVDDDKYNEYRMDETVPICRSHFDYYKKHIPSIYKYELIYKYWFPQHLVNFQKLELLWDVKFIHNDDFPRTFADIESEALNHRMALLFNHANATKNQKPKHD